MENSTPQTSDRPFPFEEARKSILTIPQVKKAVLLETEDKGLDGIRVLSDGSLPEKEISNKVQTVLLLDLNIRVNHKLIKVLSRPEDTPAAPARRRPHAESR